MTKRLVNFRLMFMIFISIIITILITYAIYENGFTWLNILCLVLFCLIILILIIFSTLGFCTKTNRIAFLNYLKKTKFSFLFLVIVMLVSAFSCSMRFVSYNSYENFAGEYTVTGKIVGEIVVKENYTKIILDNVVITDGNVGKDLKTKLLLFIYEANDSNQNIKIGNIVCFYGKITKDDFTRNGYVLNNYINNTAYTSSINLSKIVFETEKANIGDAFRNNVKTMLQKHMNSENASIAYSVLFGSKSLMEESTFNIFSYSGLAHILAVSGLHIGFLVAMLTFILKKCKANKYVNFSVITIILLVYCALCGFTPSVVRASIMSIVLLISYLLGAQYDSLSSLSFAGVIILLINPTNLFSIGFQLSFMSVLGIITLTPYLNKLFTACRVPKFISKSLAISVATNIAILPITAEYFNQFSIISIFSNIVVLPLFSITYSVLFLLTILCSIFKFMSFIFVVPDLLLHAVKTFANLFASIPYSVIRIFKMGSLALLLVILFALVIKYLMVNVKIKTLVCSVIAIVFGVIVMFSSQEIKYNYLALHTFHQYDNMYSMLTTNNNEKIVIGNGDENKLDKYLLKQKVGSLDYLVVYDYSINKQEEILTICKTYKVSNLYIFCAQISFNETIYKNFKSVRNVYVVNESSEFYIKEYKVNIILNETKMLGVEITVNEQTLLLVNDSLSKRNIIDLSFVCKNNYELVLVPNLLHNLNEYGINYENICYFKNYPFDINDNALKNYSSFTYYL